MNQLFCRTSTDWRSWLKANHGSVKEVWLVFLKGANADQALTYEQSLDEALCYGWIDSLIKRIDDERYARKFTPRRNNSGWSALNKKRAEKMVHEGKMTEAGLAKIKAAKKSGRWDKDSRPAIPFDVPPELTKALTANKRAKENFERLAPSHRRHYIAWIAVAKKAETKKRRIAESIALLEKGENLGLR